MATSTGPLADPTGSGPDASAPDPSESGPSSRGRVARGAAAWGRLPANVRGGAWLVASAAMFAVMAALIKQAGATLHIAEVLFFRQAMIALLVSPALIASFPQAFISRRPGLQGLRVMATVASMLLFFTAIVHLPLAEAITMGFSEVFFITIMAIFLLGETVGVRRWTAVAVGFVGVLIAARPDGAGLGVYSLMALSGAAGGAFVMVTLRLLAQEDRAITIIAYQALGVGAVMVVPAVWFWKTPTAAECAMLAAIGVTATLMQLAQIRAFSAAEASAIIPLDYSRLVFGIAVGFAMFGEWPSANVLIGAAIVIGAGLYTLARERRAGRAKRDTGAPPAATGVGGPM